MTSSNAHTPAVSPIDGLDLSRFPRRGFSTGAIIRGPGERPEAVFLIESGTVRPFFTSPQGLDALFSDLSVGDCIGDLAALDGESLDIFYEAITETSVVVIRRSQFVEIIKNNSNFALDFMNRLTSRFRKLSSLYIENRLLPMKARLYAELIRQSTTSVDGETVISPPPTHAELARRIASQRETVTKQLSALSKDGVLRQTGDKMVIVRAEELRSRISDFLGDSSPNLMKSVQRH